MRRSEFFDVRSGDEAPILADDDDASDGGVAVRRLDSVFQSDANGVAESYSFLISVEIYRTLEKKRLKPDAGHFDAVKLQNRLDVKM